MCNLHWCYSFCTGVTLFALVLHLNCTALSQSESSNFFMFIISLVIAYGFGFTLNQRNDNKQKYKKGVPVSLGIWVCPIVWNDFHLFCVAFLSSVDLGNLTKRNDHKPTIREGIQIFKALGRDNVVILLLIASLHIQDL